MQIMILKLHGDMKPVERVYRRQALREEAERKRRWIEGQMALIERSKSEIADMDSRSEELGREIAADLA